MARTIYCIDERGVIEQPYQTPDNMANKKGFVVKVQKIYKWKNLPVAKVLFFDCQQFSEKFRDVLTAKETMLAFLSVAWSCRAERIVASEQVSQCAFFQVQNVLFLFLLLLLLFVNVEVLVTAKRVTNRITVNTGVC